MILFDDIVEIFRVADSEGRLVGPVGVCKRGWVGPTVIDRELLGHLLSTNRLA